MFQVKKAKILENRPITHEMYLMRVQGEFVIREGQIFMLKAEYSDMSLYRPISVFDADEHSVSFLYSVRGKGTKIFSMMKSGEDILLHGPYGNGFPTGLSHVALVGGGIGMAPFLLTAKRNPGSKLFIGLREGLYSQTELDAISSLFSEVDMTLKIGGFVTDAVPFEQFDAVFTCGPEIMMAAVSKLHDKVYVSMEKHMGCGVGACLSCSCKVAGSMRKVCQDGPVFLGKEVF